MRTPLQPGAGFTGGSQAALSVSSFGSLERIELGLNGGGFCTDMRSQVAIAVFPLYGRVRTSGAVPAGRQFGAAVATLALLYDLMANPAFV
jgi:hypothetical protein